MTALEKPRTISIEDYLRGERGSTVKHEYIGGTVHSMAGSSNVHSAISSNALVALGGRLRGQDCRAYNSDAKVRVRLPDHERFYYPDAQVVCDPNPAEDDFHDRPVVVLEVLSPSTRRIDLGEKSDAYRTIPSLRVLILAESDRPFARVRRRSDGDLFLDEEYFGSDAVIALPEIGIELPLAELYDAVSFDVA